MTASLNPAPWKAQKVCDIANVDQANALEAMVAESAHLALKSFRTCETPAESLARLWALKSGVGGLDPIDAEKPMNFIEQLNQTFTYLATARAAKWLLRHHPELGPFSVNLGTSKGKDICCQADHRKLHAEVFAAARITNNNKLRRDIAYLKKNAAEIQYSFFMTPTHQEGPQPALEARYSADGIRIIAVSSKF